MKRPVHNNFDFKTIPLKNDVILRGYGTSIYYAFKNAGIIYSSTNKASEFLKLMDSKNKLTKMKSFNSLGDAIEFASQEPHLDCYGKDAPKL